MPNVKPIPDGFHAITPYLVVEDAGKLADFLIAAFGAKEHHRTSAPDGTVMHAEVSIGNSRLMLGEPMQTAPSTSAFYVYVSDVDSMYKRATGAGAKSVSQPADQFWGDRMATVQDPFGNTWSLATHKEDPTPDEMAKRMAAQNR